MPEGQKVNRARRYEKAGVSLGLPDVPEPVAYILSWVAGSGGIGWSQVAGMGEGPLSWQEIDAFARRRAPDMQPWEAEQIRAMSEAYLEGYHRGKAACVRAPVYERDEDDPGLAYERRMVSEGIKAAFGSA